MSNDVTATDRLHHPYSPSKLGYLEISPYYTGEESTNTEASEAGTAQHDATENENIHLDLDDDQAEAVANCINYGNELIKQNPGCVIIKEEYVHIDNEVVFDAKGNKFVGTTGGYCDLIIIRADHKHAEVIDYKFGLWSVEDAETNAQGIAYLLGALHRYPSLETVTVRFLMPHQDAITHHTFKRTEFPALLLRIKTIVARAMQATKDKDTSRCNTTVGSCLFCGNKGICKALSGFALKLGKKYSPLLVPENLTPSLMFDAAQAKPTLEVAQVLAGWAKAVRAQVTAKAIEDVEWMPEGYKLRSRTDKTIKDWKVVLKKAKEAGLTREQRREAFSITMTPLTKAIKANAEHLKKKAAADAFIDGLLACGALEKEQPIYFLERIKT